MTSAPQARECLDCGRTHTGPEWAVIDDGHLIPIGCAESPADIMRAAHGHGTHGPVGVAWRNPGGEWVEL